MSVSFGIEFEFDYVNRNNDIICFSGIMPHFLASNWDYQADYTASSELRSPVFTTIQQFIDECNNQFRSMIERREDLIPYPCNSENRTLGQHLHIGKIDNRLTDNAKIKIARYVIEFYPFLASIHCQPIPSRRGLTSSYTRSMRYYNEFISFSDHYAEISANPIGTVEFRIFDSNIPQASLICAFFITNLAKKALRDRDTNITNVDNFDFSRYHEERQKALTYGLIGIDVTKYLKKLKSVLGNIEIPDIPCLKESLYLLARYRLNFYSVWKYVNANAYDYMKAQLTDTSKFLENILSIDNIRHRDKIRTWINESHELENIDNVIGLSIAVDNALASTIHNVNESVTQVERHVRSGLTRSEVRESIVRGNYAILRINEIPNYSVEDIANVISDWLSNHGEQLVNPLNAREIIESRSRFYVFCAYSSDTRRVQPCGAIAVDLRERLIHSLVVDRRYRRLGIARMLVQYVIDLLISRSITEAYAWIRKTNTSCINLFESLGFRKRDHNDRSVLYAISLRSE